MTVNHRWFRLRLCNQHTLVYKISILKKVEKILSDSITIPISLRLFWFSCVRKSITTSSCFLATTIKQQQLPRWACDVKLTDFEIRNFDYYFKKKIKRKYLPMINVIRCIDFGYIVRMSCILDGKLNIMCRTIGWQPSIQRACAELFSLSFSSYLFLFCDFKIPQ